VRDVKPSEQILRPLQNMDLQTGEKGESCHPTRFYVPVLA
jgi:hypothetical protein